MKISKMRIVPLVLMIVMVFVSTSKGFASEDDNWRFSIEPYLLAISIDGDTSIGRVTGADVEVDFSDILETLEAAFMINGSAYHKSGWGVVVDYGFMKLGADTTGPKDGVIDATVRQGILEAFLAKQFPLKKGHWEIFTGIRWWDNDIDVAVQSTLGAGSINPQVDEDWVDPVIGAKAQIPMSEKFDLVLRGDIGGFGIASDFTSNITAGFHYRFTDMISLDVLYKALWVDYETGTSGFPGYFSYKTVTHGPILGLLFEF